MPAARREPCGIARGISEAAVAAQHPLGFRRDRRVFDRHAVQPGDAAAHHRHLIEPRPGAGAHQRIEAGELIGLDVDEEKGRGLGRHFRLDLMGKIGLDERDGDQHGKPDPEREHDLRGRGSRAMQIGERQAQHRPARPAEPPRYPEDRRPRRPEQCKGGDRPGHEPQRDIPVVRGNDGQSCEPERQGRRRPDYPGRDTAPRPIDGVAEQRSGGNPANSGERPERENQCRQEPEQRRQGQRRRMDRKTNGNREHPGQQRRGGDRRQSAEDERDGDAEDSEPQDFEEIGGEDQPVRGSQTFEGRDRRGLAGDVIADRIADPHSADQQRGQPDQAQKQADAIDQSLQ